MVEKVVDYSKFKVVAKTKVGAEFCHSREDAFFAPKGSAQRMADDLNAVKFHINADDEIWFVYDYDMYQETYIYRKLYYKGGSLKAVSIC